MIEWKWIIIIIFAYYGAWSMGCELRNKIKKYWREKK
jgi:hypothetical protein|tara:strand:- start:1978 stop:2088 length:111 start_codon:yes stop_codon:yes gene_type:complete